VFLHYGPWKERFHLFKSNSVPEKNNFRQSTSTIHGKAQKRLVRNLCRANITRSFILTMGSTGDTRWFKPTMGSAGDARWFILTMGSADDARSFILTMGSAGDTRWFILTMGRTDDARWFILTMGSDDDARWFKPTMGSADDTMWFKPTMGSADDTRWFKCYQCMWFSDCVGSSENVDIKMVATADKYRLDVSTIRMGSNTTVSISYHSALGLYLFPRMMLLRLLCFTFFGILNLVLT